MPKFNPGDRVKAGKICANPNHSYNGLMGTVTNEYGEGPFDYYFQPDDQSLPFIAVFESEIELLDPNPCPVTVDANGEVELPNWVKPGTYRRTDNPDGSILLEPLMTRAEWEAAK
jgi:hypothetical protein